MTSIERAANAIATILIREGIDYLQSKTVIKRARMQAGLSAPPEKRSSINRLTIEEELTFIDRAFDAGGATGLLLQTLLETGLRVSEFTRLRVEDVSLVERVIIVARGKGSKRREIPIRRELAQMLRLHIDTRRAGPLFQSRERGAGPMPYIYSRQRNGQIVRQIAEKCWFPRRTEPVFPPRSEPPLSMVF